MAKTRSLLEEARRINRNLFWCNGSLLLASLGLACLPSLMGYRISDGFLVWFCVILATPFAGLSLWNLEKWIRRDREPESFPFFQKIRSQRQDFLETVNGDLVLGQTQDFLSLTLGPNWLLLRGFFKLQLEPLEAAVWAYKKTNYAEYLMYSNAIVCFGSGIKISGESTLSFGKVDAFLEALSQAAPWVILGENDDLAKLWKKDRAEFTAQVDQRRKVLEAGKRGTTGS